LVAGVFYVLVRDAFFSRLVPATIATVVGLLLGGLAFVLAALVALSRAPFF
jgi:hypothetical protein